MDEVIPLVLDDSLVLVLEMALRMLVTSPSHFLLASVSVIAVNFILQRICAPSTVLLYSRM